MIGVAQLLQQLHKSFLISEVVGISVVCDRQSQPEKKIMNFYLWHIRSQRLPIVICAPKSRRFYGSDTNIEASAL